MSELFERWARVVLYLDLDESWWFAWLRAWRVIGRYHYGMHRVESAVDEAP